VVLFHATEGEFFLDAWRIAPWLTAVAFPAAFGFSGVYLFFVISGFCIHLAWARDRRDGLERSIAFVPFWKRRIRRLYPPYLVALGTYMLLVWSERGTLSTVAPVVWDVGLHLLMLHNIDPNTAWSINGVFWTLAIEEQLYLAYFLLLVLRVKLGWLMTLAICLFVRVAWFALAFVAHRWFDVQIVVTEAAAVHWFVWALGAWSVEAWYGLVQRPKWTGNGAVCLSFLLAAAALSQVQQQLPDHPMADIAWLLVHPMWGLGFFVLINRLTAAEARETHARTGWLATRAWRALGTVGLFSYSLYLTHEILMTHMVGALSRSLRWSQPTAVMWQLIVVMPLCLVLAWVFYLGFERPFVSKIPPASLKAPSVDSPKAPQVKNEGYEGQPLTSESGHGVPEQG
jgi:peptidoglycan/LPS O-acetylase OafA/YrhL